MAEIGAQQVKELRELTGLGMMECKKALAEAGGDLKKAEELLRVRSGAKASKASARVAAEGIVAAWVSDDARSGALVELNCETDFVAKNEDFLAFGAALAELAGRGVARDPAGLLAAPGMEARRQALVQKIGENIALRRVACLQARGRLAQYVHGGRIGVLVDAEGDAGAARDLAMHIAFARPAYATAAEVPADVVSREREILAARARESGKPEAIIAKMVEGGLAKYLAELTLMGQPFVKDDKQTVQRMLAARGTQLFAYRFLVVGEGIERRTSDFAAEVAAAAGTGR